MQEKGYGQTMIGLQLVLLLISQECVASSLDQSLSNVKCKVVLITYCLFKNVNHSTSLHQKYFIFTHACDCVTNYINVAVFILGSFTSSKKRCEVGPVFSSRILTTLKRSEQWEKVR